MSSAITKDDLIAALAPISVALVTLSNRVTDMDTRLTGIDTRLTGIDTRLTDMDTRFTDMDTRLTGIDTRLTVGLGDICCRLDAIETRQRILGAKQYNSTIGRTDELKVVLKSDGSAPICDFPRCLEQLLVAGNESLPSGVVNTWNKVKSLALLHEYDPGYDTDGMDADEESSKSRARRLKVASALGVTRMQLNFGQMSL